MLKQNIRYDVLAEPSPEYLEGKPGRNGIYTVVKLVDDLPPEIIKVFDGYPSSQAREDAYAHAHQLNVRRHHDVAMAVLVPFVEDLKNISIADAEELDRLRAENEGLKAEIVQLKQAKEFLPDSVREAYEQARDGDGYTVPIFEAIDKWLEEND